jgi:hypothetical protein
VEHAGKRQQAPALHRCKAQNKRGEPCSATIVGPGGYCTAHDPERKVDMKELGRAGGKSRRRGLGERLPTSDRESLREACAGSNGRAALTSFEGFSARAWLPLVRVG